MFPRDYDRTLFVALHGSWNRDKFNGYKVMMVRLHAGNGTVAAYEDFMTGFLQGQDTPDAYYWGGCPAGMHVARHVTYVAWLPARGWGWCCSCAQVRVLCHCS